MQIDFNASQGPSLGVEMELELVDAGTGELTSRATEVLTAMSGADGADHPKAKHELLESTVEIITGICATAAEARDDLSKTLRDLVAQTGPRGIDLVCSGTHPFSDYRQQTLSPDPRYAWLRQEMQWMADRLQIFGVHVHVGVRSAEKAIAIAGALTAYIPQFLALSASSPYWMGRDTGLASARSKVFEGLPTAGLPYVMANWAEFEEFMTTLICSQSISSVREVWWDIRPHPGFGTVELRICDGLPRMSEVTTVAALSQCLVEWMDGLIDRGYSLPIPKQWVVRQNKWKAARHGIDAEIIVDEAGTLRPMRQALAEVVEDLAPVARRLGCAEELEHTLAMVDVGPSYLRQRRLVAAGATLAEVVGALAEELRTDQPSTAPA